MEQSLRILIVEDQLSFSLELEMLVKRMGYEVIGNVDNSAEALETIFAEEPDFILMDIDIRGQLTGLQIGERIRHLDIPILYITAFGDEEHYAAAKRSNLMGYLVKPVDRYSLETAMDLAFHKAMSPHPPTQPKAGAVPSADSVMAVLQDSLFLKKQYTYHRVSLADLTFVQADDNYAHFHTVHGERYTIRRTLGAIEDLLRPSERFLRIHRSCLVQVAHMSGVDFQNGIFYIQGRELPISRARRRMLEQMIQSLG